MTPDPAAPRPQDAAWAFPALVLLVSLTAGSAGAASADSAGVVADSGAPGMAGAPASLGRIAPGTIIRLSEDAGTSFLRLPDRVSKGVLLRVAPDSLWLGSEDGRTLRPVRLADVRGVDVHAGENRVAGALLGAVAGGAIGIAAGIALAGTVANARDLDSQSGGFAAIYGAASGLVIGSLAGGVVGGIRGLDRWKRVHPAR